MNYFEFLYSGAMAGGLAYGIYAAVRNIKEISRTKTKYKYVVSEETETERDKTKSGTPRQTNCLALLGNGAVRLRNGGYLRGYRVSPSESLYANPAEVDSLYDSLATMISAKLPTGSGLQSRQAVHPDSGKILDNFRTELVTNDIRHESAFALKLHELDYHTELGKQGFFHSETRSFWIYVPVKQKNDYARNAFTEFISNFRNKGLKSAVSDSNDAAIVKRLLEDERDAALEAEKYFRMVETTAPANFKLTRLSREETWQALYYGQNENALTAPTAPRDPRTDLHSVICGERIKGEKSWYLLHGSTPVTVISMFVPPESNFENPQARAGIMRVLSNNPNLSFRHTIVTEFLTIDKEKASAKYKKALGKIEKKEDSSQITRGLIKTDRHDKRKKKELIEVEDELTSVGKQPIQMRLYIVVYGERADTQTELEESVKLLESRCEEIISVIRTSMKGADASLEEPTALRAIYERTLIGEMSLEPIGREIEEQSDSLSIFIPAESSFAGTPVEPHSFFQTTSGRLIPLNLLSNTLTTSTTGVILGETGSGKTVFVSRIITDILAHVPNARVMACDFGESLRPMVEVLNGRHLRFLPNEIKTINIWDYEGLERGIVPDQEQIDMVIEDTLILLQYDANAPDYRSKRSVLRKCVKDVYADEVPRNKKGSRRHEPVLEHLVSKLRHRHFESSEEERHALELAALLEDYLDNPWLNSPTHETFRARSPFDVFELDSLDKFPSDVRRLLAFRVGARMTNAIGETVDGEYMPTINVFDEMHKYESNPDYSVILTALKKGAAQGRKMNTLTLLIAHTYHNIEQLHNIVENTGIMFVGKQTDIKTMKEIRHWTDSVEQAIFNIKNVEGSHSQWVMVLGKGETQQAEMLHVSLAPYSLWTYTSNPNERNARTRLLKLFPHWKMPDAITWLGDRYPHGLKLVGKSRIDKEFLDAEMERQRIINGFSVEDEDGTTFEQPEQPENAETASFMQSEKIEPYQEADLPGAEDFKNLVTDFFGEDETDLQKKELRELGIDLPGVIIVKDNSEVEKTL